MDQAAQSSATPTAGTVTHDHPVLDLAGTWNARDVGRPAAEVEPGDESARGAGSAGRAGSAPGSGRVLRDGVLLRSASLSTLEPEGVATLERLGVSAVLDLRGDHEVERDGADVLPAGARQVRLPFGDLGRSHAEPEGTETGGAPADPREMLARLASSDDPAAAGESLMHRLYTGFAQDPAALGAVAGAFEVLASEPGAVLVHCSAGKDRTGWVVAVVQLLCGVAREDVVEEYLRSASSAQTLAATLPDAPGVHPAFWAAFTTVRPSYLQTALDAVEEAHGSLEAYAGAAGVTADVLDAVRARLVQHAVQTG